MFPQQGNTVSLDPQTQAQLRAYIQAQVHAVQQQQQQQQQNNGVPMDNKMFNPMIIQNNGMLGKSIL